MRQWRPQGTAAIFAELREFVSSGGLEVSSFVVWPAFVNFFRKRVGAVGAIATRIDYVLWCGELDVSFEVRCLSDHRFGNLKARKKVPVLARAELPQANDSSA